MTLWCEKHRHRPAAASGHRLYGIHVHTVDVGALFAVDFYVHEQLVHHLCNFMVLERLVCHHVAPVTRGISHR